MVEYYLALDAGSSGAKASIGNKQGSIIASIKTSWSYYSPEEMELYGVEFDPDKFWEIILNTADATIKKANINSKDICAISVTSQRQGCVFLDNTGKELYAGPNRDVRGLEIDLTELIDEDFLYNTTGHWPPFLFPLTRLLWFKENDDHKYNNIKSLLTIDAWMIYRLTGQYLSEETTISESLFYNIKTRTWAEEVFDKCGISRNIVPPLKKIGEPITPIKPEIIKSLNLAEDIVVTFSGADTQASLLGCGAINDKDLGIVAGSTMPIQFISNRPIIDPERKIWATCFYKPDKWIIEANAGSAGTIHEWFVKTFLSPFSIKNPYEYFEQLVSLTNINEGEVYADLGLQIMDCNKITQISTAKFMFPSIAYASGENSNLGVFARSVLENIAFIAKANIEQISKVTNQLPERIFLVGGLARSNNLAKILATTLKMPIHVCEPEGATVWGFLA